MSISEDLLEWAAAKGIVLNGVAPQVIPGRGIGVCTTRPIKTGEILLKVPLAAFHTREKVPAAIARKLPRISVHGLLAASLALQAAADDYPTAPWRAAFPRLADLRRSTPFFFPAALRAGPLLPGPARDIVAAQDAKFAADWAVVEPAFGEQRDRLALIPVADLLNHAARGCQERFSSTGLSITAEREYGAGEEVYICYGRHSGDFLLAEYGFSPDENAWDEVSLDEVVEPLVEAGAGPGGRRILEEMRLWGRFRLDAETAGCYRTQVALRIACGAGWRAFADGWEADDGVQRRVDAFLEEALGRYLGMVEERIAEVEGVEEEVDGQKGVVVARWVQIGDLVARTVERLGGGEVAK